MSPIPITKLRTSFIKVKKHNKKKSSTKFHPKKSNSTITKIASNMKTKRKSSKGKKISFTVKKTEEQMTKVKYIKAKHSYGTRQRHTSVKKQAKL